MRKLSSIFLAVMIGLSLTVSAVFAEGTYVGGPDARVKTYISASTATITLSSTVTSDNRILGLTYSDSAAGWVALFDVAATTTVHAGTATSFAETNVAAGTTSNIMFPFPRDLDNGLVTQMSTATGAVIVYYQ